MTSSLYYYQPVDRAYNAAAIRQSTGVDPATYGVDGLNRLGVYPITGDTTQPFNDGLWDYAVSYTVVGQYAEVSYTPTARPLATAKKNAILTRARTSSARIFNLREDSGFGARIFLAIAALNPGSRPAPFAASILRQEAVVTELGADIADIGTATTVDQLNDLVSAAWGFIEIGRTGNDLLASDFTTDKLYSKNYAATDLELYFPQTTTTVAYSGGFAATASAFTDDDTTVQLRVTATSQVIDEFIVYEQSTDVVPTEFGYRQYEAIVPDSPNRFVDNY